MTLFASAAAQLTAASPATLIVLKATAILALGLAGAWLGRGTRAAVRHAALAAAFAVLLALPLASFVIPPLGVAVAYAPAAPTVPAAAPAPAAVMTPPSPAALPAPVTPPPAPAKPLPLSTLLFLAWAAGALAFLTPVVAGAWKLRSLCRTALPWAEGQSAAGELARAAGIARPIELLMHESLPGPMTCGVLRPKILLPRDADTWEAEELNRAIVHELEHVRRADWLVQCASRAVCALYWFHPLVWMAWRRLSLEAERSCDDAVLGSSESTAYASQLVALAQRMAASKSPVLAMANRSDLATRVRSVLDSRVRRGRAGARLWIAASIIAAALLATISPLKLVSAPRAAGVEPAALTTPVSAPDSAAPPARAQAPEQPAPASAPTPDAEQRPQYYVMGDVGRPGAFELRQRTTLVQALAAARAFPAEPQGTQAVILSRGQERLRFTRADLLNHPEAAPELRPEDIVIARAEAPAPQPQPSPAPQVPAQAPPPTPTIRLAATRIEGETALVLVSVTATDAGGRSMAGLSGSEFTLTDDGAPQRIAYFAYREADAQTAAHYELGYYAAANPGASDAAHRIGVTLRNPAAKLTFRESYYPRKASQPAEVPPPIPGLTPPSLLYKASPEYSEDALKAKFQGTVVLSVELDANGLVTGVRIRRSLGLGLDQKAQEAVQRWRFVPCMNNGTPVPSAVDVIWSFRLL
jgi:TonB family protein